MQKLTKQRLLAHAASVYFLAVVTILVIGVTFIKIAPPLWGIDEVTHFSRVYQLSGGHLRATLLKGGAYGGHLPSNLAALNDYVYNDLTDNKASHYFYNAHDVDNPAIYKQLTDKPFNAAQKDYGFSGAAVYSPFAYIGSLGGLLVAKLLHFNIGASISLARFGTLAVYAGLVGYALWLLRDNKAKWLVFVIALLPESVFQASIVNVDSLAIGESLLLFAVLLHLWQFSKTKRAPTYLLVLLMALTVLLPLTKPNYYLLTLPILLLPTTLWQTKKQAWMYKLGIIGVATLLVLLWTYATKDAAKGIALYTGIQHGLLNPGKQVVYMLTHPIHAVGGFLGSWVVLGGLWINNFFGILGWNYVALPMVVITMLTGLLTFAALVAHEGFVGLLASKWVRLSFAGAGLLAALSIMGIFYLTYTPVGGAIVGGVQGRYFLPTAVFALAGLAALVPFKITIPERVATVLFGSATILCLLTSVGVYYSVLY